MNHYQKRKALLEAAKHYLHASAMVGREKNEFVAQILTDAIEKYKCQHRQIKGLDDHTWKCLDCADEFTIEESTMIHFRSLEVAQELSDLWEFVEKWANPNNEIVLGRGHGAYFKENDVRALIRMWQDGEACELRVKYGKKE